VSKKALIHNWWAVLRKFKRRFEKREIDVEKPSFNTILTFKKREKFGKPALPGN
jgi:hypothetical protein